MLLVRAVASVGATGRSVPTLLVTVSCGCSFGSDTSKRAAAARRAIGSSCGQDSRQLLATGGPAVTTGGPPGGRHDKNNWHFFVSASHPQTSVGRSFMRAVTNPLSHRRGMVGKIARSDAILVTSLTCPRKLYAARQSSVGLCTQGHRINRWSSVYPSASSCGGMVCHALSLGKLHRFTGGWRHNDFQKPPQVNVEFGGLSPDGVETQSGSLYKHFLWLRLCRKCARPPHWWHRLRHYSRQFLRGADRLH